MARTRKRKTSRANPFAKGKSIAVPKGKRKGETFVSGGKRYMVISYTTKTGKRVRRAQPVKGLKKRTIRRTTGKSVSVSIPKGKSKGQKFTKNGKTYVVVSFVNKKTKKRVRFARKVK